MNVRLQKYSSETETFYTTQYYMFFLTALEMRLIRWKKKLNSVKCWKESGVYNAIPNTSD